MGTMHNYKILYTADLHGNEAQYQKLTEYALDISPDCIILGGDLAPKGFSSEVFIQAQRRFIKEKLPQFFHPPRKKTPTPKVFLIMGNDDCATNEDVLHLGDPDVYQVIHGRRIGLTDSFDIVGYSFVPMTPFGIKDWEKFDLSVVPSHLASEYADRKQRTYRREGLRTRNQAWEPFQFRPEMERSDSIQKDLSQEWFQKQPSKTCYVIHTPPNQTHLDQIAKGVHVGSFAVRSFIETSQPYLTLHGHIHETVDVSGHFKQTIGNTVCLAAGNHNVGAQVAVLVFDVHRPQEVERVLL